MKKNMKTLIAKLQARLPMSEIELRIGYNSVGKGFTLLPYKNSRVDVHRLDSVFPGAWKNVYKRGKKNELICGISIWNHEIEKWVTRWDTGNESFGKENAIKGEYSDSFKRAAFRWGIGTELYDMPFIWIPEKKWVNYRNKKVPIVHKKIIEWYMDYKPENDKYLIYNHENKIVWEAKAGIAAPQPDKAVIKEDAENAGDVKNLPIAEIDYLEKAKTIKDLKNRAGNLKKNYSVDMITPHYNRIKDKLSK
jgi:hypothetical protein